MPWSLFTFYVSRFHISFFYPFTTFEMGLSFLSETNPMRKTLPCFAVSLVVAALVSGCANTERKFGRGMSNMFEIVRGGEFRRSMEQTGLFDGPDAAYGYGFVHGINRTFARTGIGFYEV